MNVPKLRFKEFNDEWCKEYAGNLCSIQTGKSNTQDKTDDGIYPFYVRSPIIEKSHKFIFDTEAVLTVGDGVGVGKVFHYINGKFDCHQRVYMMNNFNKITAKYFYYIFSRDFDKRVMKMTAKTSVDSVRYEMIDKMQIFYPTVLEQNKISRTLELLDKKIELQSKKIEDLKLFKKGLLRKEFNNKKCSNKLKECFDFGKAGGTPKSTNKDYYNGYIPFLSISDMTTQGKYIYYTDKSITEAGLNNSTAWLVPKNSIIISMYASYGLVSINKIDLATSQAMFNMVINKNYVVEYIYYYLYYLYISSFYNSIVSTGTQSNLNAEQIKLLDIYIPCYKEQKRIHEQFSKIDFKINLEQKKFNELLYLKKGLMQNMFV